MNPTKLSVKIALGVAGVLLAGGVVVAATFSQSYQSKETINPGTIVELTDEAGYVQPASFDGLKNLLGVAVEAKETLLSSSASSTGVPVVTSGLANTIVSDFNGVIKAGDRVTASPISGVGMKANSGTRTLGVAQADFPTTGVTEAKVDQAPGGKVKLAKIQVSVGVTSPGLGSINSGKLPSVLQSASQAIAGKPVANSRVLLALLVFILSVVGISVLLYGAVKNSLISIGRNPLAKAAVFRSLGQVLLIVTVISIVAVAAIYVTLTF